ACAGLPSAWAGAAGAGVRAGAVAGAAGAGAAGAVPAGAAVPPGRCTGRSPEVPPRSAGAVSGEVMDEAGGAMTGGVPWAQEAPVRPRPAAAARATVERKQNIGMAELLQFETHRGTRKRKGRCPPSQ